MNINQSWTPLTEEPILPDTWNEISSVDQTSLIEWYNQEETLDNDDYEALADLWHVGGFSHWDCPECGEKVRVGQPDDWEKFMGVSQSEPLGKLCADCGEMYSRHKEYAEY